jgi:hypothetical protein
MQLTSDFKIYVDAGTLTLGHETDWTLTIPPASSNYMIVGHCAPSCSNKIPQGGISVFNVLLHSHLSGRIYGTHLVVLLSYDIYGQNLYFLNFFCRSKAKD